LTKHFLTRAKICYPRIKVSNPTCLRFGGDPEILVELGLLANLFLLLIILLQTNPDLPTLPPHALVNYENFRIKLLLKYGKIFH
jgi:hypothetical protein